MRALRLLALALVIGACSRVPEMEPPAPIAPPDPTGVERAIFFVGDPGKALSTHYPILSHLRQEVERWSALIEQDSAVIVLNLGDVIYPNGMHAPSDREDFPVDSALMTDQLRVVGGEAARAHATQMFVLTGNHDWGSEQHEEGLATLRNLERFLDVHRELGYAARLAPPAGEPGPVVIDAGPHLRLVLFDTSWWLLQSPGPDRDRLLDGIEQAMRTAGARHVVLAAHHPYMSAGPHGGELSFMKELGVGYILKRSGAILQDLNSPPYRRLRAGLGDIFEELGAPLMYAAGHEHSLQLIEGRTADEPRWSVVSGSASKVTSVGHAEGMRFRLSAPGYFLLLVRNDGSADLHAYAAPTRYLTCPEEPAAVTDACMREGVAAYLPRFTQVLTE